MHEMGMSVFISFSIEICDCVCMDYGNQVCKYMLHK